MLLGLAEPKPVMPVQSWTGEVLLRGPGSPETKSFALSSVSKQPSFSLRAADVFESVVAGPDPSKHGGVELPYPITSMIPVVGQLPVKVVELFTRATLPAVAPIVIVPLPSGVGRP